MAELIPLGTNESAWFDVTVAQGQKKSLYIKGANANQVIPSTVQFVFARKKGTNDYTPLDIIHTGNIAQKGNIESIGTFGVKRLALSAADIAAGVQGGMDVES